MSKKKVKRCPHLEKYNFPFHLANDDVADWYKKLCDYCPLVDSCIEDWRSQQIPKPIREKLLSVIVPCPKCNEKDKWWEFVEDGLKCIHCAKIIYQDKPLKFTRARLDGGIK